MAATDDVPDAAKTSLRYQLEEYAIFSCLCEEEPTTLIYDGSIDSISMPMKETASLLQKP
jgi:hypothetical protein